MVDAAKGACLTDSTVGELLEGLTTPAARRRIDAHVDACPECFALVSEVARLRNDDDDDASDPRSAVRTPLLPAAALAVDAPLPTGARLGRYVVQSCLGAGGMGIVYAAYDPDLDRRVALKLLRVGALGSERARRLLHHEARAMARLSHPNVVAVHDTGLLGDQLFLVMELVDGLTLDQWCATRRPSASELVGLFLQAARGLAAAHAAGLVHRDFKPSNVLVEPDGRVRVTDFGLAHLVRSELAADRGSAADAEASAVCGAIAGAPPSRLGPAAGTPAYMAPEQFLQSVAGPAADQFSFCVALYQLLYGQRPFEGADLPTLRHAVLHGSPKPPPRRRGVPSWLEPIVLKGLARDPHARHPSLEALAAALTRDPGPSRARLAAAVLVVAALGATTVAATRRDPLVEPPCRHGATLAASAWGPPQRSTLEAALLATKQPAAAGAVAAVSAALDRRTRAWERAFQSTCEATWVRHVQSESLLDRRMACLTSRLSEQRALIDLLALGGRAIVETAPTAVYRLSPLEDCDVVGAQEGPLPLAPSLRGRAAPVEQALSRARAELAAGRIAEALASAEAALAQARSLAYRPLEAEALTVVARAKAEAGELAEAEHGAREAMRAAEVGHHDSERARALATLVDVVGVQLGRVEAGLELTADADALVQRLGDPRLEAVLAVSAGTVLTLRGDSSAALVRFSRAVALLSRVGAERDPLFAAAISGQGRAHLALGRYEEARTHEARALALRVELLGAGHPDVARSLVALGVAERHQGRLQEAREHQERALRIQVAALGVEHPAVAATRGSLATTTLALGQHDVALSEYQAALSARRAQLGAEHPEVAGMLVNLGRVFALRGELDEAAARYGEALRLQLERPEADREQEALVCASLAAVRREQGLLNEATELVERSLALRSGLFAADHPAIAASLTELGHIERARRRPRAAEALYERARASLEARLGPRHPELSEPLGGLGLSLLDGGDPARAAWFLERALAVRPPEDPDPAMRAELSLGLATALAVDGGNRSRTIALAQAASSELDRVPRRRLDLRVATRTLLARLLRSSTASLPRRVDVPSALRHPASTQEPSP